MPHTLLLSKLAEIRTPAYVANAHQIKNNLSGLENIRKESGLEILYAIKACPFYNLFSLMSDYLDGSTASGLYEARLGSQYFGKQVHVFCPAYTNTEIQELIKIKPIHVYFNSAAQLQLYAPIIKAAHPDNKVGLRVNPALSSTRHAQYDPCRRGSHLGVPKEQLDNINWDLVDVLHVHALCENLAEDSARLINHVAINFAPWLARVSQVNFGGGHFITHADYNAQILVDAVINFRKKFPHIQPIIEPGAAMVLNAGYLVTTILEIVENDGIKTAILDASANSHVPDIIKAGVRLRIVGADDAGPHQYTFSGRTCMACDIWGEYSFSKPLEVGMKLAFIDGLQYSLGEANWFNGHPRPDLGIIKADNSYEIIRQFTYEDFVSNVGKYPY